MNRAIVWFRQDLRLHDNEAITEALKFADEVLYVYIFEDTFLKSKSRFGFQRTEKHRLKFIIESVADLRENLRASNADLIVRCGNAEDELFKIAARYKSAKIFCNRESTHDEILIQDKLEKRLWTIGQEIHYVRGKMLYYTQDLPFPISHTPDSFKAYRKEVEKIVPVRKPLETPLDFKYQSDHIDAGRMPELSDYGHDAALKLPYSAYPFKGGETEGRKRMEYFLRQSNLMATYSESRLGLSGSDYSTKLSAYLAQGCISPKYFYHQITDYETIHGESKSTYELKLDLLWRDYLRLIAKKYKTMIFYKNCLKSAEKSITNYDTTAIINWTNGNTGEPYIDAIMKELNATGFISYKCRQLAAAFFIYELKQNWQTGAEYFESRLIDYDVCSNWVNWNYIAGLGIQRIESKGLNVGQLAQKYDPDNRYLDCWNHPGSLKKFHPGMLEGK